ncbi:hypothetical protein GGR52DRAFT_375146 [Hypoxylon sp. FL1284]|nr:hypothetical protein GGR52DRAFT_375146 [Hypoxylon sp. FL1284]
MSAKSGPSAATTSNNSSGRPGQPVALETYLASPPTITETLAFPSTTEGASSGMESKNKEVKGSLDQWQSTWDSMNQSRK